MENKKVDLTSDDEKLIQSLEKDYRKFKGLIFAGSFAILCGVIIGAGSLYPSMDKSFIIEGIFFITVGIMVIQISIRNRKVYQLLKKLLSEDNRA